MSTSSSSSAVKDFKAELKALLIKYDAEIDFGHSDCSDTYGICDAHMVAFIGKDSRFHGRNGVRLSDGWGVEASDL
jgi:hypothetical protein